MTLGGLLRKFRRRYLWALDVHTTLGTLGPLSLQIQADRVEGESYQIQAESRVPDQDFITRLAVLMYPLLDPDSDLYWQRILTALEQRFREHIPSALRERLHAYASRLADTTDIPIQVDGARLDPQQLYLQFARGFYFGREPQAQAAIHALFAVPLMGPLLWSRFYVYTVNGFELTSVLYDIVLALGETEAFQEFRREQKTGPGQCIYCTQTEGSFTSEEHILPEALGNDDLVLARGYVCDGCNNGLLALLDRTLLDFPPIAFLRAHYVPHLKGGKFPSANLQNMEVKKTLPTRIEIHAKDKAGLPREEETLPDGSVRLNISARGTWNTPLVARAYCKIALGTVAHDEGAAFALDSRYDPARLHSWRTGVPQPLVSQQLRPGASTHDGVLAKAAARLNVRH
jgi:hypothetical protein